MRRLLNQGQLHLAMDIDTGELIAFTGDPTKKTEGDKTKDNYEELGPVLIGAQVGGSNGNRAEVSDDGALKVADWGGHPVMGSDATGANTYAAVLVSPKRCRNLSAAVTTQGAVISLDGGKTDALAIIAGNALIVSGLDIPAGANIQARNLVAGSNYTNCTISVW